MPLKIKKKKHDWYLGLYDITHTLPSVCKAHHNVLESKVMLCIHEHGFKGGGTLTVGLKVGYQGSKGDSKECVFETEGYNHITVKLALLNLVRTLYQDIKGGLNNSPAWYNWAATVMGTDRLFKDCLPILVETGETNKNLNQPVPLSKAQDILKECSGTMGKENNKLGAAVNYYDKVQGTSKHSVYAYVGYGKGVQLGMRIKTNNSSYSVSVRAESIGTTPFNIKELELLGLEQNGNEHYSCHFGSTNDEDLERYLILLKGCLLTWKLCDFDLKKIRSVSV